MDITTYDPPNPRTIKWSQVYSFKVVHFHLKISAQEQLKTKKFLNLCLTNLKIVVITQFNQSSGLFIQLTNINPNTIKWLVHFHPKTSAHEQTTQDQKVSKFEFHQP